MNQGLQLPRVGEPFFLNTQGQRRYVRKTEQHYKLFFKLRGCASGLQHYRRCTPHSLQRPSDLWCPFCMYSVHTWQEAGKALITSNELRFMQLLRLQGGSDSWCHQARHDIWHGCFDFYNWRENVFVQVDGACHWRGMRNISATQVQHTDFLCNLTAFNARVGLLRVHEDDLQQPPVVFAAIAAAAVEQCVVFTSSFMTKAFMHVMHLLQAVHMYCLVRRDSHGNLICKCWCAYPVLALLSSIISKLVVQPLEVSCPGGEVKVHQPVVLLKLRMCRDANTKVNLAVSLAPHCRQVQHITGLHCLSAAPHLNGLVLERTDSNAALVPKDHLVQLRRTCRRRRGE